ELLVERFGLEGSRHHSFLHHLRIDHLFASYIAYADYVTGRAVCQGFAGSGGFDAFVAGDDLYRLAASDRHALRKQRWGEGLAGADAAFGGQADHFVEAVAIAAAGFGDVDALQFEVARSQGLAAVDQAFGMDS